MSIGYGMAPTGKRGVGRGEGRLDTFSKMPRNLLAYGLQLAC